MCQVSQHLLYKMDSKKISATHAREGIRALLGPLNSSMEEDAPEAPAEEGDAAEEEVKPTRPSRTL